MTSSTYAMQSGGLTVHMPSCGTAKAMLCRDSSDSVHCLFAGDLQATATWQTRVT